MKIGWDGLPRLIRNFWQKKSALPLTNKNETMPYRLVARVKQVLDSKNVLLNWEGRVIHCRVDTPVRRGEYLLLQFKNWSGKKQLYQVLARNIDRMVLEGEKTVTTSHMLLSSLKGAPLPLMLRVYNSIIQEKEDKQQEKKHSHEDNENRNKKTIIEFVIETAHLGVVIVKIQKQKELYTGKLLVENQKTGKILDQGLAELEQIINLIMNETDVDMKLHRWEVVPLWKLQEIKKELAQISFGLDRKV